MIKKIENKLLLIKNKELLYKVVFVSSICYYFTFVLFGLDFTDTYFHINNSKFENLINVNFLTVFSTLIMNFLTQNITQKVIILRVICGLIKIAPLFIYCYCIFNYSSFGWYYPGTSIVF